MYIDQEFSGLDYGLRGVFLLEIDAQDID